MNRQKRSLARFLCSLVLCSLIASAPVRAERSLADLASLRFPNSTSVTVFDEVDPFIGTAAPGHTYPGATVPFGMVQVSPDTYNKDWAYCAGYNSADSSMLGFSHTHLSGTGCGDLGDILFAATTGPVNLVPGTREAPEKGYRSRFSHDDEQATPGYYAVNLKTYGIKAEVTATEHVGLHRYTFPKSNQANIIVDLAYGIEDKPAELEIKVDSDRRLTGMRRSTGWAKDKRVYFVIEFSQPFVASGITSSESDLGSGKTSLKGDRVKSWVTFNSTGEPIVAKVAISTVSVEGANHNLVSETPGWNFDDVRQQAKELWNKELGKVAITGGDSAHRRTFYTALYHTMLAPTVLSDVDGQFRGSDNEVHKANGFKCFSTFSLWDTFRAEHPLFTIIEPNMVADMLNSFEVQAQYHPDKTLPIWPLYANETYCMIGYHSFPVIVDAYLKGIKGFNSETLYKMMLANTKRNDWWTDKGYIPSDKEGESVSKTLEFAFDDWALAQMAGQMHDSENERKFLKRASVYKNVFDPQTKFMRGRMDDGTWRTPFNPAVVHLVGQTQDFTEADSWQYTFCVLHDVQGLIDLLGGRQKFVDKLDALFSTKSITMPGQPLDVTGLIGEYAHGNEPSHHVAYLYSYAGCPAKTQDRVREIEKLYDDTRGGLCGNEDCGQMSAWYVFSALGFYPVNPAQGTYVLGTPMFPESTIHLDSGKTFKIVAHNMTPGCHIGTALLNGKKLSRVYLTHRDIVDGGILELHMVQEADPAWGKDIADTPSSMTATH